MHDIDKDYAVALQLQEQYDRINNNNSSVNVSVSDTGQNKRGGGSKAPGMNLGSPTLERSDPTPNVHNLFINFNRTFFWGKLASVAVRWSKRMYSCAGTCSYHSRSGFCDVALSEPLLKLRPRKDLVETLLHEMIHAYLFVTSNDRDRNGHGPNFLSHMHRINKAASLNISIYHTFHDEVNLYQTHWWRCNGPCQKQKPYFGLVKRSSNRAPGPNDFWWKTHQFNCGGTFIKIKEPEKKGKAAGKSAVTKNNNKTSGNIKNNTNNSPSNVRSIKDLFNNSNIGVKNKENNFNQNSSNNSSSSGIRNSSSTILLPNKTKNATERKSTGSILPFVKPSDKKTNMNNSTLNGISNNSASDSKSVMETVRNVWLQRFSSICDNNTTNKRPACSLETEDVKSSKIIKLENPLINNSVYGDVKVKFENIPETGCDNNRLDYLETKPSTSKDNIKSEDNVIKSEDNVVKSEDVGVSLFYSIPPKLVDDCNQIMRSLYGQSFTLNANHFKSNSMSSDIWKKASEIDEQCKVECPLCNGMFVRSKIETHVNHCLDAPSTSSSKQQTNFNPVKQEPKRFSNSQTCSSFDLTEEGDTEETNSQFSEGDFSNCPLCNKRLNRNDADEHLEQCVSMTFVNETITTVDNDNDDTKEDIADEPEEPAQDNNKKVSCPCCFKLFEQSEINRHLDDCLL